MNHQDISIGMDLGGTSLKYALVQSDGLVLWQNKCPSQANISHTAIIQTLIQAAKECQKQAQLRGLHPSCIGVGTPGLVDVEHGIVLGGADNLVGWENIALADLLSKDTGLPVFVDNDGNMMGMGEVTFGMQDTYQHILFLTIGTGIGGAIFIDGKLYRGHRFAAGELGSIMMHYQGEDAYWEEFAATSALVRQYAKAVNLPSDQVNGKQIFDLYLAQDPIATQVLLEHARLIGYGLAGYLNIFNPEKVIIGGGISEAGEPYIQLIDQATRRYAMKECAEGVHIQAASLGNQAGFLGAAKYALDSLSG